MFFVRGTVACSVEIDSLKYSEGLIETSAVCGKCSIVDGGLSTNQTCTAKVEVNGITVKYILSSAQFDAVRIHTSLLRGENYQMNMKFDGSKFRYELLPYAEID